MVRFAKLLKFILVLILLGKAELRAADYYVTNLRSGQGISNPSVFDYKVTLRFNVCHSGSNDNWIADESGRIVQRTVRGGCSGDADKTYQEGTHRIYFDNNLAIVFGVDLSDPKIESLSVTGNNFIRAFDSTQEFWVKRNTKVNVGFKVSDAYAFNNQATYRITLNGIPVITKTNQAINAFYAETFDIPSTGSEWDCVVKATDLSGRSGTATFKLKLDESVPAEVTGVNFNGQASGGRTSDKTPLVAWTNALDADSGIDHYEYILERAAAPYRPDGRWNWMTNWHASEVGMPEQTTNDGDFWIQPPVLNGQTYNQDPVSGVIQPTSGKFYMFYNPSSHSGQQRIGFRIKGGANDRISVSYKYFNTGNGTASAVGHTTDPLNLTPNYEWKQFDIQGSSLLVDDVANLALNIVDNPPTGDIYLQAIHLNSADHASVAGQFNVPKIETSGEYEVWVRVVDRQGNFVDDIDMTQNRDGINYARLTVKEPLPAPANVTVAEDPDDSLKVRWDSVTGATKYFVYSSSVPTGIFAKIGEAISPTAGFVDNVEGGKPEQVTGLAVTTVSQFSTGLQWNAVPQPPAGETHYYKVTTVDADGDESVLSAVGTGTNQVTSSLKEYVVYRDGREVTRVPAGNLSYVDAGLAPGTQFRYQVAAATQENLEGPKSEEYLQATMPADPAVVSPSHLINTWTNLSPVHFNLTGAQFYRYVWNNVPVQTVTTADAVWTGTPQVPTSDGPWYLHVMAYSVGHGGVELTSANQAHFGPILFDGNAPTVVLPPPALQVSAERLPAFAWKVPESTSPVLGYSWYFGTQNLDPDMTVDGNLLPSATPGEIEWRSLTRLADGTYYFSVRAKDEAGNWGAPAKLTYIVENPPDAPQVTSPSHVTDVWTNKSPIEFEVTGTADHFHFALTTTSAYDLTESDAKWISGVFPSQIPPHEGAWYLHVVGHDVGYHGDHQASAQAKIGPFLFDNNAPVLSPSNPVALTNDNTPSFAWNVQDLNPVSISTIEFAGQVGSKAEDLGFDQVYENNQIALTHRQALPDGSYQLGIAVQDTASNQSALSQVAFTIDTVPPKVLAVNPRDNSYVTAEEVKQSPIQVIVSEALDEASLKNVQLLTNGNPVPATVTYDAGARTITLVSQERLDYLKHYNVSLNGVTDLAGNPFNHNFAFHTLMDAAEGGTVVSPDGRVKLDIQSGSLPRSAFVEIVSVPENDALVVNADSKAKNYKVNTPLPNGVYKITARDAGGSDVTGTNSASSLLFMPNDTDVNNLVDGTNVPIPSLNWYRLNASTKQWELIPGSGSASLVPMAQNSLNVSITQFQTYRLMGIGSLAGAIVSEITNKPNPFNPNQAPTTIEYQLEQPSDVTMVIYDLLGNLVLKRDFASGTNGGLGTPTLNQVPWDGRNGQGDMVASGGYIAQFIVRSPSGTTKVRRKIGVVK